MERSGSGLFQSIGLNKLRKVTRNLTRYNFYDTFALQWNFGFLVLANRQTEKQTNKQTNKLTN